SPRLFQVTLDEATRTGTTPRQPAVVLRRRGGHLICCDHGPAACDASVPLLDKRSAPEATPRPVQLWELICSVKAPADRGLIPGTPNSKEVISQTSSSMNCIGASSMNSVKTQFSFPSRYLFTQPMHRCHYQGKCVSPQNVRARHLSFDVPKVRSRGDVD